MQAIVTRKKAFIRIIVYAVVIICAAYGSYKGYKRIVYWKIWHDIRIKQKKRLVFSCKPEIIDPTQKGYILLSPYTLYNGRFYGELIIMDVAGHILLQKQIKGAATDFRQWNINGHIRYSYFKEDTNKVRINEKIGTDGYFVVLDSALNELKQIHLLAHNDIIPGKKNNLDGHDLLLLSDDHYVAFCYYEKRVNNIPASLSRDSVSKVIAPVIQEVQDGKVIWQWDATNYPEFYVNSEEGNKFQDTASGNDYIHMNSMVIDPADSNLIVSCRNENQVVKINRHNGYIIWRLGGKNSDFPLTATQVFLRQHNVTLTDSSKTLLVFDNGEATIRPFSRILEFKLDEKNKTVTSFRSFNIPEIFSPYRGSVQKKGDDYFICGGYYPYLLLVNNITGVKKIRITYNQSLYRAYLVKDITGIRVDQPSKK